jgi:hypothetical protein
MLISLAITSQIKTISGVWSFMIECGAGLGLVLILRWYWWRINAWSEFSAMLAPFVFYALSAFVFKLEFPNSYFITVGGTTLTWLIVTFITKPTDNKVLQEFYKNVKPQGWWKPYSTASGNKSNMINLFGSWITSVIVLYSILFLIGNIILHNWNQTLIYTGILAVSFVCFWFFVRKAKIFED